MQLFAEIIEGLSVKQEKRHYSFPLRLSPSIRQQAEELAHTEGISLNHFISLAVAEKNVRMERISSSGELSKTKQAHILYSQVHLKKPA
jgi:hypothetical protein